MVYIDKKPCPKCGCEAEVEYDSRSDEERWSCPNCGDFVIDED